MNLPFSVEQFLGVFASYNLDLWPMQVIVYFMGAAAVYLAIAKKPYSSRVTYLILAFFWLWNGIVYHISYFSAINKAAYVFGLLFVIQGIIFIMLGRAKMKTVYRVSFDLSSIAGGVFIIYAMLIYPAVGYLAGHGYPHSPPFGLAPCPTTIFTFGLLLWVDRLPGRILGIPLLWSLIGFSAALKLGIVEDTGLLAAGIIGTLLVLLKNKGLRQQKEKGKLMGEDNNHAFENKKIG